VYVQDFTQYSYVADAGRMSSVEVPVLGTILDNIENVAEMM
jgi:hypothetical protein